MTSTTLILISFLTALVPTVVGLFSAYLKIHVVLSMLRNGLGTQNFPSGLIIMSLSIALTVLVMAPVISDSYSKMQGLQMKNISSVSDFAEFKPALEPWFDFMRKHAGRDEIIKLQHEANKLKGIESQQQTELLDKGRETFSILAPAFVITELKEGIMLGFAIMLPFLVIDLATSTILTALGMQMLSPVTVAFPLKLLLFVLADGWNLIVEGLLKGYL